ncbi:MAG TPA: hypothetical protein VFM46_02140, partial [Pseudomonadales bacterium]|nr:hypothetical protein [Pseudomonadales bacterium]
MRSSWVWLVLLLLMPGWAWSGAASRFDLSAWKFEENGAYELSGQWELYWDELREPGAQASGAPVKVELPLSWVFHPQVQLPRYGVASYRTLVRLPDDGQVYGMRLDWIFSAYRVYWNGKLLREVGKLG